MKRAGIIIVIAAATMLCIFIFIKKQIPINASSNDNKNGIKIQLQGLLYHKADTYLDYEIWFKADRNQIVKLNQGMYFMSDLPLGLYEIILMKDKSMSATGEIQFIYQKDCKLSTMLHQNCNQIYIGDFTKSIRLDLYIDLHGKIRVGSLEYVQGGVRDLRKSLDPSNIVIDLFVTFIILMAIYCFVKKTSYTFGMKGIEGKR